ncbi:hypothetical protein ACQZV8_05680 [Magnetococcales bacterium HHB-1]
MNLFILMGFNVFIGIVVIQTLTYFNRLPRYSLADWLVDFFSYEAAKVNISPYLLMFSAVLLSISAMFLWPVSMLLMAISKREFCPIA